jgi:hypothetical protein
MINAISHLSHHAFGILSMSVGHMTKSEISGSHGGEYEDGLSSGLLRRLVW